MNKRTASDLSKRVVVELKNARNRGGWLWTDIEEATGIAHSTMQRMLSGEVDMSVSRLLLICEAAGISASDVLAEATRHMPDGYLQNMLVSPPADNVADMYPNHQDWDMYEGRKAADNDAEAGEDEPSAP